MHDLFDALIYLFDTLLTPFTGHGDLPKKRWVKIAGALLAIAAMLTMAALVLYTLSLP